MGELLRIEMLGAYSCRNARNQRRDRSIAESDFAGIPLRLIDTAGFDKGAPGSLTARMLAQTEAAISESVV